MIEEKKSLPQWILIVSGIFSLLEIGGKYIPVLITRIGFGDS